MLTAVQLRRVRTETDLGNRLTTCVRRACAT